MSDLRGSDFDDRHCSILLPRQAQPGGTGGLALRLATYGRPHDASGWFMKRARDRRLKTSTEKHACKLQCDVYQTGKMRMEVFFQRAGSPSCEAFVVPEVLDIHAENIKGSPFNRRGLGAMELQLSHNPSKSKLQK